MWAKPSFTSLRVECGDAKSAFLKADEGIGTDNLFTRGVAEIRHALGVGPKEALKVVGAICGLPNAPRIFWRDVDSKLQKIGFVPHAIDKCVWIFKSRPGKVIGRIGSHLDNFLLLGDHQDPEWQSVRSKVFDMYSWSPWKRGQFTFAGIQLQQLQNHSITLSQGPCRNQLQPVKIENEGLRPKDDTLTAKTCHRREGWPCKRNGELFRLLPNIRLQNWTCFFCLNKTYTGKPSWSQCHCQGAQEM